ncbi:hypothetical protein FACS1894219_02390 [Clostridia bacterium]|nr:hypothetical protein FACS1894219_02390 [Clostridia bacterium]
MRSEIQAAEYLPQEVRDYRGNPLIEALPPICSKYEAAKQLAVDPGYHESERELDAQYRSHSILRLFRYFQPLDTHLDIAERIAKAIRQGYIARNPATPLYADKLNQGADAISNRDLSSFYAGTAASFGFSVVGLSGVGKTTGVTRVLSLYPQSIQHTQYNGESMFLTQLVWAKVDCPIDGSVKGLCFDFFAYVDRVLGTDYLRKFSLSRMTVDAALPRMAQIANAHCLGLLVIDEIQHLSQVKSGGQSKMLNFFVTLVNTVGVPVVLIGTSKARFVLQSDFRQARRSSGQGGLIWDRMQNDFSWEITLKAMWKYQWLQKPTPLTDELKNALYDESQGIMDIAVKLYAMAQSKAIADGTETITVNTIKEAAAEKLQLVRPMLQALRDGDAKKLARYDDIRIEIDDYLYAQFARITPTVAPFGQDEARTLSEQAVLKMIEMDIPSKVARSAVSRVLRQSSTGQPLSAVMKKAMRIALNIEDVKEALAEDKQDGDLRNLSTDGGYEELKNAGVIAESSEKF